MNGEKMNVKILKKNLIENNIPVLVLPIWDEKDLGGQAKEVDKRLGGFISKIIKDGYYKASLGKTHVVYTHEKLKTEKIVLAGLGKKKDEFDETWMRTISAAVKYSGETKAKKIAVYIGNKSKNDIQNLIETSLLSLYGFNVHKSKKSKKHMTQIDFLVDGKHDQKDLDEIAENAKNIVEGIYLAKDLANHPSNYLTPSKMVKVVEDEIAGSDVSVKVFNEKDLEKMGMGLMVSVTRGSAEDGKMIVMDYNPKESKKTLALIGKGLTFDSGGHSLKPADAMMEMKMDMAGAAAVIGAFKTIKKIKPKNIRIIGLIGACENLPGAMAQKPGDVWKSYSGKTVEVLNTDAEGRLVLADVMSYAQDKYKPDYMVDLATLTGACWMALGSEFSGMFSNETFLADKILKSSEKSYDKVWPLPINKAFHDELKSSVADLNNLGAGGGRVGGASTAAAFLEEFVEEGVDWVHLDIAGPSIITRPQRAYQQKGAGGAGVKVLIDLVNDLD